MKMIVTEHRNSICRYSISEKRRIINRRKAVIIGKMEDNILELKEDLSLQFKGFHWYVKNTRYIRLKSLRKVKRYTVSIQARGEKETSTKKW